MGSGGCGLYSTIVVWQGIVTRNDCCGAAEAGLAVGREGGYKFSTVTRTESSLSMHEMSLCEGMLQIIDRQAALNGFRKVVSLRIELGEFSGACEDSLRFCFPLAAKGTVAADAVLEFVHSPDRALRIIDMDVL